MILEMELEGEKSSAKLHRWEVTDQGCWEEQKVHKVEETEKESVNWRRINHGHDSSKRWNEETVEKDVVSPHWEVNRASAATCEETPWPKKTLLRL